jgi:hypothetical protein
MLSEKYNIPLLGQLPINPMINELADQGRIEEVESEDFTWLIETIMEA